ncbi:MAG: glycosyl transferase family 1 [Prevotellaceae bacterium]|jgi:hypothetical protein|nr:glycosyl transferase family 1 [Prevotellaceae bacterium]
MKRVLIITYYWAPSGGAGVQRWLKFSKYLPEFGWQPVVYTPLNPEYPSIDHSLEKDIPSTIEVLKKSIWEPYNIYRNLLGKKNETINAGFISEDKPKTWKEKLSIWIRGNFLIPDPRRFWIRPSVRFLRNYLKSNPVNAIITTGPPHSMHLIGLKLKKQFPDIPWIADFRDPWTNIDFYQDLHLTRISDYIHHKLEKKIVESTDYLMTVSPGWKNDFPYLSPKSVAVVTNGYDEEDGRLSTVELDPFFSIAHIGTLNDARNPLVLWNVLRDLCAENMEFKTDLRIRLTGKTDYSVISALKENDLEKNLIKTDYLPHTDAVEQQKSSQILLLLINKSNNAKSILTGKFFEYLLANRPILAIGPTDGDVADILNKTNSGLIADFDDEDSMKKIILNYYDAYKKNRLSVKNADIKQFSRKSLTSELSQLLDSITPKATVGE